MVRGGRISLETRGSRCRACRNLASAALRVCLVTTGAPQRLGRAMALRCTTTRCDAPLLSFSRSSAMVDGTKPGRDDDVDRVALKLGTEVSVSG